MADTSYDAWDFSSDPININSPNVVTGAPSYNMSIPENSGGSLGSSLQASLASLLNFSLAKDKLAAQTQIATAARSVYPYGVNPLTGAPNTMPATQNLTGMLVIGGIILLALHFAKAV